jgi:hypothetical protein
LPLHVPKDCPVEIAALLLALLEVLGADLSAQGIEERVVFDIQPIDIPAATQHVHQRFSLGP